MISILFLAADPSNASRLQLGEEFREIQEKVQLSKSRDRFSLEARMSVRPTDISQALLDLTPKIVILLSRQRQLQNVFGMLFV